MRKYKPVKKCRHEARSRTDRENIAVIDTILHWGRRHDIIKATRELGLTISSPLESHSFRIQHDETVVDIDPYEMTYHNLVINQRRRIRDITTFLNREFNLGAL